MRAICCVCGLLYDVKEPMDQDVETHGYCEDCFEILMSNYHWTKKEKEGK